MTFHRPTFLNVGIKIPVSGILYYISPPLTLYQAIFKDPFQLIIYTVFVVFSCIVFSQMWVEVRSVMIRNRNYNGNDNNNINNKNNYNDYNNDDDNNDIVFISLRTNFLIYLFTCSFFYSFIDYSSKTHKQYTPKKYYLLSWFFSWIFILFLFLLHNF